MKRTVAVAALLMGLLPGLLVAQPASARGPAKKMSAEDKRARDLFLEGDAAYSEGRYEDALSAFEEAYRLSQRPLLLFNLANVYERLGRYADAADALERYLPDAAADEKPTIEKRLESLKQRAAAEAEPEPEPTEPEPAEPGQPSSPALPPSDASEPPPTTGYVLIGVGGVAIAAGTVFGVLALGARGDADAGCSDQAGRRVCSDAAADAIDRDRTYSTLADVGFGVGLVAAAVGVTLVLRSGPAQTESAALGFVAGPRPAGGEVRFEARF